MPTADEKLIEASSFKHFKKEFKPYGAERDYGYDFNFVPLETTFAKMQPECWTVKLYTCTSKIDATTGTRTSQHEPYEKDFTGGELWKMLFHGL
jgi:hypothetical protein